MTEGNREPGIENPVAGKPRDELAAPAVALPSVSPWERIKSHKVVQWTAAYVATAYVFLHGVEMVSGALSWPHFIVRVVTLILLLGVPVTVTLAWFHGHRGRQRIGGSERAILAAILALAATVLWYLGRPSHEVYDAEVQAVEHNAAPSADAIPTDKSIAVLPFVNMSSDPEQEYFSDGMAEQVLNLLSKVPELRVIARTSSFSFKGKEDLDVPTIAQRLNVSHVLEGSVRKSANRVRVTVQLVNAADSSRKWSETYDRDLTDVFAVQDEIALDVVRQLKVALQGGELPAHSSAASLDAYNLYLRGQHLADQHTSASMAKAVQYYKQAIAKDPGYGEAWATLAYLQALTAGEGSNFSLAYEQARGTAQKAIDLDSRLPLAHLALGSVQHQYDWNWNAANESFARAMALDPGDAEALAAAGSLAITLGQLETSIELCKQAVARNPVSALHRAYLAFSYVAADQLDKADVGMRTALELSPEFSFGRYMQTVILLQRGLPAAALEESLKPSATTYRLTALALANHAVGQKDASDNALNELIEKHAAGVAVQIAQVYAFRGATDEALTWLDRAYRQRDPGLIHFHVDPLFQSINRDPRFAEMLQKMKLPNVRHDQLSAAKYPL
jgi:TolB-like protein/Tfp pilus assembly protein PilF